MSFSCPVGASRGFQRDGLGEQVRWRGEGSRGDRADPSGTMQGNSVPPTAALIRNHNTAITSPGAANEALSSGL